MLNGINCIGLCCTGTCAECTTRRECKETKETIIEKEELTDVAPCKEESKVADGLRCGKEQGPKIAYICSPYRGNLLQRIRNIRYAKDLTKWAMLNGYVPITPHLYLPRVLKDKLPRQRQVGLKAGLDLLMVCNTIIVGSRYGISQGMRQEIETAKQNKRKVIIRPN